MKTWAAVTFWFIIAGVNAGSEPGVLQPGGNQEMGDVENDQILCQDNEFFPVNITAHVISVNITNKEHTNDTLTFSCEAVGSSCLSLEWGIFRSDGQHLALDDLNATRETRIGNFSICSSLMVKFHALYSLGSVSPLSVVCNVSQYGPDGETNYTVSSGEVFLYENEPLLPTTLQTTPHTTISPSTTPSMDSKSLILSGDNTDYTAIIAIGVSLPVLLTFFFVVVATSSVVIVRTKNRKKIRCVNPATLENGKSLPLRDSRTYSSSPDSDQPDTREGKGPRPHVTTGTSKSQCLYNLGYNTVIGENYLKSAVQCIQDNLSSSNTPFSKHKATLSTSVSMDPHEDGECILPDCMCQAPRCKVYDNMYAQSFRASTRRSLEEQQVPRSNLHTAAKLSLSSISNDECYIKGITEAPERAINRSTPPVCDTRTCPQKVEACTSTLPPVPFLARTEFKVDSSGGVYEDPHHDFTLSVPEGAIPPGETLTIEIRVTLYGPFQFPNGLRPISPIIWLCVQDREDIVFEKPIEITLPHCLQVKEQQDIENLQLTFLKANHSVSHDSLFTFTQAEGTTCFKENSFYGQLMTKHFCFLCIAARLSPEDTGNVNFCLVQVQPCPVEAPCWTVYFCVAYFLKTCIESIRKQYPTGHKIITKKFQFTSVGQDARLQISFSSQIQGGWILALQSDDKISAREVDFWGISPTELDLMHEEAMYPPRFTIEIAAEQIACNATANFNFSGAHENLDVQLILRPNATTAVPVPYSYRNLGPSFSLPVFPVQYPYLEPTYRRTEKWGPANYLLPDDYPTDEELDKVTSEVMGRLQQDWPKLQAYLGVPSDVMLEVKTQPTLRRRVFYMLKSWRDCSPDGSKAKLAECLRLTDCRLNKPANELLAGNYRSLTSLQSSSSASISSGSNGAITWPRGSLESLM